MATEAAPTACDEDDDDASEASNSSHSPDAVQDAVLLVPEGYEEPAISADEHHDMLEPILELKVYGSEELERRARKRIARNRLRKARSFECFLCKKEFASKSVLNKHMKAHVRDKRCTVCDTACTEAELNEHFCDVLGEKRIACEYCGQWFTKIVDILTHLATHDAIIKFYWCSKCTQLYALRRLKEMHETIHAFDKPSKYVCNVCCKELANGRNFSRHMATHKENRECE